MFFTPSCPLELTEKVWTERHLRRLTRHFGARQLLDCEVLTPATLPASYGETRGDVEPLLQLVCRHLGVPASNYRLTFLDDSAGVQLQDFRSDETDVARIKLSEADLPEPVRVVAVIAGQIAAHRMTCGENPLIGPSDASGHLIADLYAVFCGLGAFQTHVAVTQVNSFSTGWETWSVSRQGHLPARMSGYAMALMAWARGEQKPVWADALGVDARQPFKKGLKFLHKTGDSVFQLETAESTASTSATTMIDRLRTGSPSSRMDSLMEMQEQSPPDVMAAAIFENLFDREATIVVLAAGALSRMGPAAGTDALEKLISLFETPEAPVRAASVFAASRVAPGPDYDSGDGLTLIERTAELLQDANRDVVLSALAALGQYGEAALAHAHRLVPRLAQAARACDFGTIDILLTGLKRIVADLDQFLGRELRDLDVELRERIEFQLGSLDENHMGAAQQADKGSVGSGRFVV